jgi:predicted transcriptional regulator
MIEQFKDNEVRNTGVIYSSVLEQIKGLYAFDPEQAGELAISAIELILTGDMSTDDINIKVMLAPIKKLNEVNFSKYDSKLENQKQKKIVEMKLDMIADLFNKGLKQREIGERMGLSQQVVSYRIDVIKKKYPELLTKIQEDSTKIQTNSQNTKKQNFVQVCTDKSDFVQNSVGESVEPDRKLTPEEARKAAFNF